MFQPRDQFPQRPKYAIEVGGTTLSAERALDIVRRQWPLIVAIVAIFGWSRLDNDHFKPQNEFKLDTWFSIGPLDSVAVSVTR